MEEAHKRGLKVTGHLCSIGYREAAEIGIDNLEHGLLPDSEFVANKQPDKCPGAAVSQSLRQSRYQQRTGKRNDSRAGRKERGRYFHAAGVRSRRAFDAKRQLARPAR